MNITIHLNTNSHNFEIIDQISFRLKSGRSITIAPTLIKPIYDDKNPTGHLFGTMVGLRWTNVFNYNDPEEELRFEDFDRASVVGVQFDTLAGAYTHPPIPYAEVLSVTISQGGANIDVKDISGAEFYPFYIDTTDTNNNSPACNKTSKKKYTVTMSVRAKYTIEIEVPASADIDDIKEEVERDFFEADFGDAYDIVGEPIDIKDEKGHFLWQKQ